MSANGLSPLIAFLKSENYHFITPTPATHTRNNQRAGNERARTLMDVFGWSRPFVPSLLPGSLFTLLQSSELLVESAMGWKSLVRVSSLDGELFIHSAFPTVSPESVFFGPDTYRFARAIKNHLISESRPLRRALDLGCGSGAGGVILAKNSLCRELVLADINDRALQLAHLNAEAAGVPDVTTVQSDLCANVEGQFDMIVANPPYLNDPLQRAYRHGGGELGSRLSLCIAELAKDRLSPGGTMLLYTGSPIVDGNDGLLRAIEVSFAGQDLVWSYEEIDPDVFGEELETDAYDTVERIAAVLLTARMRGA